MRRGTLSVTVPMHPGDLPIYVLRSILQQAQMDDEEFANLL
jgi:predicted RNA binding protein YcfA (HicA-like mRNA interferase family)